MAGRQNEMAKRIITTISQGEDPDLSCLGPNWSEMSFRQKHLYGVSGGLSQSELDMLWGAVSEETDDAA